jgi:rubrerythrin
MPLSRRERDRLAENLVDELNGAALYDSLAAAEKDTRLAEVYRRLANVERRHAERWRRKLEEASRCRTFGRRGARARWAGSLASSARRLPSQNLERADTNKYATQASATCTATSARTRASFN